jgi:TPR repeat protein
MRTIIIALLLSISCNVFAQSFSDGSAAFNRGDYETAFAIFLSLAEQGDITAQKNLGVMYRNGEGVAENDAEAMRWIRLAAEQGDANAQLYVGLMYRNGEGVPENDTEAVRWFRLAAEQGFPGAQNNLGFMYQFGNGVPENDAEAVRWYRLAAEQGDNIGQLFLGEMYADGEGVPQNYFRAYVWWSISAALGNENSRENRDEIKENLTNTQLAQAQELATRCFESDFQDCE